MINDDMDDDRHEASSYQRVELITGRQRRRQWTAEEKADIVLESFARGANISEVARRRGVSRGLLSVWRRQAQAETGDGTNLFVPVEVGQEQAASEATDRLADIALPSSAGSVAAFCSAHAFGIMYQMVISCGRIGSGAAVWKSTVKLSICAAPVMAATAERRSELEAWTRCNENSTSSAVKAEPSCHFTPGRK